MARRHQDSAPLLFLILLLLLLLILFLILILILILLLMPRRVRRLPPYSLLLRSFAPLRQVFAPARRPAQYGPLGVLPLSA